MLPAAGDGRAHGRDPAPLPVTWDRPPSLPGWGGRRGGATASVAHAHAHSARTTSPDAGTEASTSLRNTRRDACWQTHPYASTLLCGQAAASVGPLIGWGMGLKGGQGQGWSQAGSGLGPTCLSVQARPWLQAGRPPADTSSGGSAAPLLFIRELGRAGDSERGTQAHPGQVGDLERRRKEGWGP